LARDLAETCLRVIAEEPRRDVFNYTELFYNPKRRHGSAGGVSPIECEKNYYLSQQSV
jgi:putative transposase